MKVRVGEREKGWVGGPNESMRVQRNKMERKNVFVWKINIRIGKIW